MYAHIIASAPLWLYIFYILSLVSLHWRIINCVRIENKLIWFDLTTGATPDSCCEGGQVADCGKDAHITIYSLGSYQFFWEQFEDNITVIKEVQEVTPKKDETAIAVTEDLEKYSTLKSLLRKHSSSMGLLSNSSGQWKKSCWKISWTKNRY